MSTIRATIMHGLSIASKEGKKFVETKEVTNALGFQVAQLGTVLYKMVEDGFANKKQSPQAGRKTSRYTYSISKSGIAWLASNIADVMTESQYNEALDNKSSRPANKAISQRYSPNAANAIDGIAQLIDDNEKLLNSLRAIYRQLGVILAPYNKE